jgi:hypothetical protein
LKFFFPGLAWNLTPPFNTHGGPYERKLHKW